MRKYIGLVAMAALLTACPSKFNVDNVSVGDIKQAQKFYEDCIIGVKTAVDAVGGDAEKAKAAAKGVKVCVDKYADVLAGLLVQ